MGNFQGRKQNPSEKPPFAYSRDPGLIRVGETWHETGGFWAPEIPGDGMDVCCVRGIVLSSSFPIGSMYGISTYIWLIFMVNVGKSTIHGPMGLEIRP